MLTQLIHNGVVVPEPPAPRGLTITVRGRTVVLMPEQEEMALAWARKQGTPYVEDPVFVGNFLDDLSAALGFDSTLAVDEVDFGPVVRIVEAERAVKERLTQEERKALAVERKAQREALRERFGYATVNGERVEVANYVVEPGGIFMGRGEHPLRGRWKEGARQQDVTLNLSPDAPRPPGAWAEIVWEPESLWVARWKDKLSDKLKYVWLGDTASVKQAREAQKFDQAHELHAHLDMVRAQIECDLQSTAPATGPDADPRLRMIATACYLIDALCLRVGDEKDADEADTVGATTLRPEHVTLHPDDSVEFEFLGKDSVLWHKRVELPEVVRENLAALIGEARPSNSNANGDNGHPSRDLPQIFPGVSSRNVNAYLSDILPGLTAKVFRTHHATIAVKESLEASGVQASDPEHSKWEAANLANLEAAILCNHTRQAPAGWPRTARRFEERERKAEERVQARQYQVEACREALAALRQEAREREKAATPANREKVQARYAKRIERAERRLEKAEGQLGQAHIALGKVRAQASVTAHKRAWNLGTSLKSYIDPRVYHEWGQRVDYDVLDRYYPKALRHKFAWVREPD